jgi:hypothetical protein
LPYFLKGAEPKKKEWAAQKNYPKNDFKVE